MYAYICSKKKEKSHHAKGKKSSSEKKILFFYLNKIFYSLQKALLFLLPAPLLS
jgi:hypothetical protein